MSKFIKYENARCVICNKVSHSDISSDYGEHFQGSFSGDVISGFECSDCRGEIEDVLAVWGIEDELKEKGL